MMTAARHPEQWARRPTKNRCHNGDVREVCAAREGVIERIDFARPNLRTPSPDNCADSLAHRAEMHGHMGGICDELSIAVEHRTRKIKPFLDINRVSGVLKDRAHLLRNRHEHVIEKLQQHWVSRCANGKFSRTR